MNNFKKVFFNKIKFTIWQKFPMILKTLVSYQKMEIVLFLNIRYNELLGTVLRIVDI